MSGAEQVKLKRAARFAKEATMISGKYLKKKYENNMIKNIKNNK